MHFCLAISSILWAFLSIIAVSKSRILRPPIKIHIWKTINHPTMNKAFRINDYKPQRNLPSQASIAASKDLKMQSRRQLPTKRFPSRIIALSEDSVPDYGVSMNKVQLSEMSVERSNKSETCENSSFSECFPINAVSRWWCQGGRSARISLKRNLDETSQNIIFMLCWLYNIRHNSSRLTMEP